MRGWGKGSLPIDTRVNLTPSSHLITLLPKALFGSPIASRRKDPNPHPNTQRLGYLASDFFPCLGLGLPLVLQPILPAPGPTFAVPQPRTGLPALPAPSLSFVHPLGPSSLRPHPHPHFPVTLLSVRYLSSLVLMGVSLSRPWSHIGSGMSPCTPPWPPLSLP